MAAGLPDKRELTFSVIIPTLNEAAVIAACLEHVQALSPDIEIIVADGGSGDDTVAIARQNGAVVCLSPPGRGLQCNTGAAQASGDILLFLHADTALPPDALVSIASIFRDEKVRIATFGIKFGIEHRLLKLYSWLARLNLPFSRFGDQCIVIRKTLFRSLDGFRNWPLFEDADLIRRAGRLTRVEWLPGEATTSAHRFLENGILRQELRNIFLTIQFILGVSPQKLAHKYRRQNGGSPVTTLLLFVRYPEEGRVKSRLASFLGDEAAARFYRRCARNLAGQSRRLGRKARRYLCYSEQADLERLWRWLGSGFRYRPQIGEGLGQRMENAFITAFAEGAGKVIILASDTPDLTAEIIEEAIAALEEADTVIGPCHDGGYYLLGMKELHRPLFDGIPWSTDEVVARTLEAIESQGLSCRLLPTLADIDTGEDLRRWETARATTHGQRGMIW
jgi:rSAM/selenodomain-associated transferase 2/rSAM/selenodomain-associated transferase 1